MLPHSIEIASTNCPSLFDGFTLQVRNVAFHLSYLSRVIEKDKKMKNGSRQRCFLNQIYFNTRGYLSTIVIHYWPYFKKSNKHNSISFFFSNSSYKKRGAYKLRH